MSLRSHLRLAAQLQLLPVLESGQETLVGGQAVMEGVMMRAPHSYCIAVRRATGEIVTQESPIARMSEMYPIFKLPILRGVATLGQAMSLGIKSFQFSANVALADENKKEGAPEEAKIPAWAMSLQLIISLAFFLGMYKMLPAFLTQQVIALQPALHNAVLFSLVEGIIRLAIFIGFMFALSRYKDIHRVFEFHGAEHKVVFNYESGQPVNTSNSQAFTTLHPRCGTSFLLVVMVISMLTYMVVDPLLGISTLQAKILSRIALLPLVAGMSYELIRFAARRQGSLMAALTAPGLWLQRITTQPPDDSQVDVAIHALNGAMELEKSQGGQLVIA